MRALALILAVPGLCLTLAACATSSQSQSPPQARQQPPPAEPPPPSSAHKRATSQSSAAGSTSSPAAGTGAPSAPDPKLVEQTRADQAALEEAESDFRKRRADGSLDAEEASDYAGYVAGLQRKVVEDCVALESSGAELPDDLPCETTVAGLPSTPLATDPSSVVASPERTEQIDAELRASLGEFDEVLIQGQETLDGSGEGGGHGSGTGGYGDGAGGAGAEQGDASGEAAGSAGETSSRGEDGQQGSGGQRRGSSQGGLGSSGGAGAPPAGDPGADPHGDDVVARQLREAAEKETDPELKQKLWEEYRKYKQGTT